MSLASTFWNQGGKGRGLGSAVDEVKKRVLGKEQSDTLNHYGQPGSPYR